MRAAGARASGLLAALIFAAVALAAPAARAADDEAVKRGAYLFAAADCAGCHTDVRNNGKPLAGGRALTTPFGTFYGPNITPDAKTGIGDWTEAQFRRALREGINNHGSYMFPVFPFASFTGLTDADISDLWAFLRAQTPVQQRNKPHEITPPFGFRFGLLFWRALFFREGPWQPDPAREDAWNRGSYLANAVAHCGECHTPRNFLGAMKMSLAYSGNPQGPDNQRAPNITPDPEKGIGKWSLEDIETVLKTGQLPYFDTVGSGMAEVVKGTSQLTDEDRHAIAVYLKSLKPVPGS
jgi:mono/diheme cytochrome c family protein